MNRDGIASIRLPQVQLNFFTFRANSTLGVNGMSLSKNRCGTFFYTSWVFLNPFCLKFQLKSLVKRMTYLALSSADALILAIASDRFIGVASVRLSHLD